MIGAYALVSGSRRSWGASSRRATAALLFVATRGLERLVPVIPATVSFLPAFLLLVPGTVGLVAVATADPVPGDAPRDLRQPVRRHEDRRPAAGPVRPDGPHALSGDRRRPAAPSAGLESRGGTVTMPRVTKRQGAMKRPASACADAFAR